MRVVGEGVLPSPVRSFAWSPTIDLCVFVMARQVSAHRLKGQKVWTITCNGLHSPDLEFTHASWRNDGKLIATGLDDGSVYVWDVQDGRKVRQVMLNSLPQGPISCLNWITEDANVTWRDSTTIAGLSTPVHLEDLDVDFDVERYLPYIKAIGRNEMIKPSDDTLGEPQRNGDSGNVHTVDMVFIGSETGQLELSVFGTFSLASMNTNYSGSHKLIVPIHHSTTPDLALHALVGRSSTSTNLYLNFFANHTLQSHGKTLRQLTASSTTINTFLAYLEGTWTSIAEEWREVEKVRTDVVSKLIQCLNEDPDDKPSWWGDEWKTDAEGALLCLLMTGVSEVGIIKWFTEKFATVQNAKKWEKRILDGYDAIRTFIHEHIIPVGERISIVLSRLRGLSIWSNQSQQLPLYDDAISEALKAHDTLFIRAHEILRQLVNERSSFEKFASWLVIMAEDIFAHEDANVDPPSLHTIDTVKVAEYITNQLQKPILAKFAIDMQLDSNSSSMKIEGYDAYLAILNRLTDEMRGYFRHAAAELREGVSWWLPDWVDLQIHDEIAASDVFICNKDGGCVLFIAVALPKHHEVRIYRYSIVNSGGTWYNGLGSASPEIARFRVKSDDSSGTALRDLMFLDETDLLVIGTVEGAALETGFVMRMAYNNNENFQSGTHFDLRDASIRDKFNFTGKEGDVSWCPLKGACNGREMRRIMCVVDRDEQKFRMLEIDGYNHDEEMST